MGIQGNIQQSRFIFEVAELRSQSHVEDDDDDDGDYDDDAESFFEKGILELIFQTLSQGEQARLRSPNLEHPEKELRPPRGAPSGCAGGWRAWQP